MSAKQALGRGFDSLIPTDFDVGSVAQPGEQIRNIDINKVKPNPAQPRKEFDERALKELAQSIKQHGVIQPLVVTPDNKMYRIVAGERRYRAAKLAKLTKLPAVVRNHAELEELEIALVENVQRVDLSPLEQAVSIAKLRDQFSLSLKEISQKLGKAETTISNSMRLLQLPEEAVQALQKNQISEGHARAILALKTDTKRQKILLNKIITQKWSVRQAEDFVKSQKADAKRPEKPPPKLSASAKKLIKKLPAQLADRLNVQPKSVKAGTVRINYGTPQELEELLKKLS